MMEAEIYGMMPRAKIDRRFNEPPENMLNISRMVPRCCSTKDASTCGSIPGSGMKDPMRKTTSAPMTKKSRWRSSFICPMFEAASAMEGLSAI